LYTQGERIKNRFRFKAVSFFFNKKHRIHLWCSKWLPCELTEFELEHYRRCGETVVVRIPDS